jgi:hypothetical protein
MAAGGVAICPAVAGVAGCSSSPPAAHDEHVSANVATFLETSTDGRLGASALVDGFLMHEDHLFCQIKAYAERDYGTAHESSYDAYRHMFALAAQAATAIGNTVAARSPEGGAQTGAGGTATITPP